MTYTGVEYQSPTYYQRIDEGWVVIDGPSPGADGVMWVVMAPPWVDPKHNGLGGFH